MPCQHAMHLMISSAAVSHEDKCEARTLGASAACMAPKVCFLASTCKVEAGQEQGRTTMVRLVNEVDVIAAPPSPVPQIDSFCSAGRCSMPPSYFASQTCRYTFLRRCMPDRRSEMEYLHTKAACSRQGQSPMSNPSMLLCDSGEKQNRQVATKAGTCKGAKGPGRFYLLKGQLRVPRVTSSSRGSSASSSKVIVSCGAVYLSTLRDCKGLWHAGWLPGWLIGAGTTGPRHFLG